MRLPAAYAQVTYPIITLGAGLCIFLVVNILLFRLPLINHTNPQGSPTSWASLCSHYYHYTL